MNQKQNKTQTTAFTKVSVPVNPFFELSFCSQPTLQICLIWRLYFLCHCWIAFIWCNSKKKQILFIFSKALCDASICFLICSICQKIYLRHECLDVAFAFTSNHTDSNSVSNYCPFFLFFLYLKYKVKLMWNIKLSQKKKYEKRTMWNNAIPITDES